MFKCWAAGLSMWVAPRMLAKSSLAEQLALLLILVLSFWNLRWRQSTTWLAAPISYQRLSHFSKLCTWAEIVHLYRVYLRKTSRILKEYVGQMLFENGMPPNSSVWLAIVAVYGSSTLLRLKLVKQLIKLPTCLIF